MKKLKTILLVDDNKFTNIFNQKMLEKLEAAEHIYSVENGKEAMEFITRTGKFKENGVEYPIPNLILLDINMPVMDGWEFLGEFQQVEHNFDDFKIIMLTTSPNPDDEQKARSNQFVSGYYNKPLSVNLIDEILHKHFVVSN